VPVIGGEQIQLKVPARLMADVLPVEDHAQPETVPRRDDRFGLVAGTPGATGRQRRHGAAIALSGTQLQYPTLIA
jgi:hypothetical protein